MATTTGQRRPPLRLDDQLCFSVHAASRAIIGRYRPLLDELGLTYPQYLVMLVLWEQGPTTVGALGGRLHLDSGTLSPLLKRLEQAGLVERTRRPEDERSVLIATTDAGERMQERSHAVFECVVAASGMPAEEVRALQATLERLTAAMRED